jgi:hypothetical protein
MRSYSAAAARVEHRFDPRRPFLVALALPARRFLAAVAAAQIAGGSAVAKMKPGA